MDNFPLIQLLLSAGLIIIGVLLLGWAFLSLIRFLLQRWAETTGVIDHLEIVEIESPPSQTVTIVYNYEVGGTTYTGRHLAYEIDYCCDKESLKSLTKFYPQGKNLTVYFSPDNPHTAQLERSADDVLFFSFILTGAGLIALIIGLNIIQNSLV